METRAQKQGTTREDASNGERRKLYVNCLFFPKLLNRLHPMLEYLEAAEDLAQTLFTSRYIFFSTDNATLIEEIEEGSYQQYNFTFFYTR